MRLSARLLLLLLAHGLHAERLPVRLYTTADGLPGISIHRIVPDSKGFLWFCTNEGLARFDQYDFVNYGKAHGFTDPNIYDLLETRGGDYWVGTAAGLYLLTRSTSRFALHSTPGPPDSRWINTLKEDPSGVIWVGTRAGLFRLRPMPAANTSAPKQWSFERHQLPSQIDKTGRGEWVTAILRDRGGVMWIGGFHGLYAIRSDRVDYYSTREGLPSDRVWALAEDGAGVVSVATSGGLCRLTPRLAPSAQIVERSYEANTRLPAGDVQALLPRSAFMGAFEGVRPSQGSVAGRGG